MRAVSAIRPRLLEEGLAGLRPGGRIHLPDGARFAEGQVALHAVSDAAVAALEAPERLAGCAGAA
jgi:hypothetical protein